MKNRPKRKIDEVNYWEPLADSMVGLLLLILLVMLLLVLFVVRTKDNQNQDMIEGEKHEDYEDPYAGAGNNKYGDIDEDPGDEWEKYDHDYDDPHTNYGGGGGAGSNSNEFDDPDPGAGEGDGTDKAAVQVQLVDADTGRTIKLSGIEFELYGKNGGLETLSVYYPQKIDYKKFKTTESGTFYLPEKVSLSTFTLHGITEIDGYDTASNTEFTPDSVHGWDDPYIVSVPVSPSKNVVKVQLKDKATGLELTGVTFEVVADGDVVTKDGTTRYRAGEVVDTIVLDDKGYGESKEIFLGKYYLREKDVPEYYAKFTESISVELKAKGKTGSAPVNNLVQEKTAVTFTVYDELYDTRIIQGATFELTDASGNVVANYQTDDKGRFTANGFKKNTVYHISQTGTIDGYHIDKTIYDISVDDEGHIEGEVAKEYKVLNRTLRVTIGVRDMLFKGQMSDINIALRSSNGTIVKTFNTTGIEETIEGLEPGEYLVIMDGFEDVAKTILVEDKPELQEFYFDKWTPTDIGSLAGAGIIGIILVILIIKIISMRIRKKRELREEGES